jgi:hypothetical protein
MAEAKQLMDLAAKQVEPLSPELEEWVEEDGTFGRMLRHPLVYQVPFYNSGLANEVLAHKRARIAEAVVERDWHTVVFLHERPHRLAALIDYCTGRYDDRDDIEPESILPLCAIPEHWELAADVWVDSENINQNLAEWRALIGNGDCDLWLGTEDERAEFDALPDPIPAYRGGSVGDWSWTTDLRIAEFFANRCDLPVRHAMIPKSDCFGYLTRRSESELLVRLTEGRIPLVYPGGMPGSSDD